LSERKEKVKQMIKNALPDEQWKIDPEFFDFILDVLIDLVVMFLNRGLWKSLHYERKNDIRLLACFQDSKQRK